jgi:hypothetical protein
MGFAGGVARWSVAEGEGEVGRARDRVLSTRRDLNLTWPHSSILIMSFTGLPNELVEMTVRLYLDQIFCHSSFYEPLSAKHEPKPQWTAVAALSSTSKRLRLLVMSQWLSVILPRGSHKVENWNAFPRFRQHAEWVVDVCSFSPHCSFPS